MKPTTRIALANLLSAAGSLIDAFAAEVGGPDSIQGEVTGQQPEAPAPKKTRGKAAAAAPAAEKPADPAPAETAAEETKTEGVKTYDELRAMIEPLVKAGQGPDVKTVIAKYAEGGLKELATKPEHHAAFEKDLAALSY